LEQIPIGDFASFGQKSLPTKFITFIIHYGTFLAQKDIKRPIFITWVNLR